ncbi:hypothetical protein PGT21_007458 [Puccinia graminis f. sp. tritici]|uniref:Uncharacterized protein n=1 Tax=Puccinia graminis f. sp. tritici TaxID=56615 RepID=A0A5B0RDG6_PUCGR|nr:hypothetical protein PGT21_007458 [Puccinia graminis f. sp. tritici]KAA1123093.1 hypothetical protein PGTUg99_004488 [Puccinia graminis f. sp. tritici]
MKESTRPAAQHSNWQPALGASTPFEFCTRAEIPQVPSESEELNRAPYPSPSIHADVDDDRRLMRAYIWPNYLPPVRVTRL